MKKQRMISTGFLVLVAILAWAGLAHDLSGQTADTVVVSITIDPKPTEIVTESPMPNGEVGAAYSETLEAIGGDGTYWWSLVSGTLPDGLTLDPATGEISGVPTAAGTTSFEVEVSDVPVTQPGTDGPVFDPATGTMLYEDNMDSYTDVVAMGALPFGGSTRIIPNPAPLINDPVATDRVEVVTGRGGAGKALRMKFPGTVQSGATFYLYQPPTTAVDDMHFFQYWGRINFSTPFPAPGSVSVKWFMAFHNVLGRVQWNTHDPSPCGASFDARPGTFWQVYDQSVGTGCQGNQPVGPFFDELDDNLWHRYTYQYKPNTSEGSRDGVARMWIDGVKIIDVSMAAVGVTPPGGQKTWCELDDVDALAVADGIYNVWWGATQTTETPSWTLDIDDFAWWILTP